MSSFDFFVKPPQDVEDPTLKAMVRSREVTPAVDALRDVDWRGSHGSIGELKILPTGAPPPGTFCARIGFTLENRYYSADALPWFPIDNALRRDHALRCPMIPGSTWKGSLRAAAYGLLFELAEENGTTAEAIVDRRLDLFRIFGDEKGEDDRVGGDLRKTLNRKIPASKGPFEDRKMKWLKELYPDSEGSFRGHLRCLPSFFAKTELDPFNKRNSQTRTGSRVIYYETIPPGSESHLYLFYVPTDLIGASDPSRRKEDWKLIASAVREMLRNTGFGAKKFSGYGRAREAVDFAFLPSEPKTGVFLENLKDEPLPCTLI